jgi:hypothetical protein
VQIVWDTNGGNFCQRVEEVPPAVYHYVGVCTVGAPYPIPDRVDVQWKTKDGAVHRQTVAVPPQIAHSNDFTGSVFYRFAADGVSIVPRTYAEQERNVAEGKAAVP